jgi:aldose 1-epimerase
VLDLGWEKRRNAIVGGPRKDDRPTPALSSATALSHLEFTMISFGRLPDGREARLYTLSNTNGVRADISDYGGAVVRLFAPDRHGARADIVLGFDRVEDYVAHSPYFGCLIGRCGNRIANGIFSLDGKTYSIPANNTPNGIPCHLHGGVTGFDKVIWRAELSRVGNEPALQLHYRSVDGEEGYPGNLDVTVTYLLTANDELRIDYRATGDRATPVNLTHHSYFNLAGEGAGDVLRHVIKIDASGYTPVDQGLIPLGNIAPVTGTPFDFREARALGERIEWPDDQLRFAGGYDHNFCLDRSGNPLFLAATVFEPQSGRVLDVRTTEPGLQLYSGNFLTGGFSGKNAHVYPRRSGLCLETQHFPDAPNRPAFPSVILRPGDTLHSTTIYRFSAR